MTALPSKAGKISQLNALILGEALASEEDHLIIPSHDLSAQTHVSSPGQVVFAGFFSESLAQRIIDCKPKIVITCHAVRRESKTLYLKDIVDAAVAESSSNGCVKVENYWT
ncbi:acetyl-coenzyme A synthetase, chloroplastic/glyoxysomal-like [Primulina tabacum]|uniref:acetyl-coenzyme A synthetase, chloroplastic/glyoxysomal-like n=1 Tax=Primulina tabacum TaxID=48773 RepID=UPI003F598F87